MFFKFSTFRGRALHMRPVNSRSYVLLCTRFQFIWRSVSVLSAKTFPSWITASCVHLASFKTDEKELGSCRPAYTAGCDGVICLWAHLLNDVWSKQNLEKEVYSRQTQEETPGWIPSPDPLKLLRCICSQWIYFVKDPQSPLNLWRIRRYTEA